MRKYLDPILYVGAQPDPSWSGEIGASNISDPEGVQKEGVVVKLDRCWYRQGRGGDY